MGQRPGLRAHRGTTRGPTSAWSRHGRKAYLSVVAERGLVGGDRSSRGALGARVEGRQGLSQPPHFLLQRGTGRFRSVAVAGACNSLEPVGRGKGAVGREIRGAALQAVGGVFDGAQIATSQAVAQRMEKPRSLLKEHERQLLQLAMVAAQTAEQTPPTEDGAGISVRFALVHRPARKARAIPPFPTAPQ